MADNEVETKGIPSRRDRGDKGYFAKVVAWWRREIVQEVPPELAYCEFECACYRPRRQAGRPERSCCRDCG